MRRAYLGVVLAAVLPAISVFAQGRGGEGSGGRGGGGGFHGSGGGRGGSGGFHSSGGFHGSFGGRGGFGHGGGIRGRHGFYHGRGYGWGFHRHGYGYGYGGYGGTVIIGGYGWPYCYPYCGFPYYDDYPYSIPPTSDYSDYGPDGYYGPPPSGTYNPQTDPSADNSSQGSTYTAQDAQGYYQVGDQWGVGMKQYKLTTDQLVTYLKTYIADATPAQQEAFRSGFIASAIPNGAATYDQAMQQAAPQH